MTKTIEIQTPCGALKGQQDTENNLSIFRGIPFATAKRFGYPTEVTHWEGIYSANEFGPAAFQESAFCEADPEDFYQKEFYNGERLSYSEDCLFLNIWAPADARNAPVLVYVHGGAFDHGYSYEKPFDGTEYCKRGILVVTLSYRLSVFGYLTLPEFADASGHYGNYALFDIKTALEWIQHNIASFGGDPNLVTLSGQSAGAMSVQALCLSPLTDGLFQRAYLMSGGGVSDKVPLTGLLHEQETLSRQYMEWLHITDASELLQLDAKTLICSFHSFCRETSMSMRFCVPTVDGYFLPKPPLALLQEDALKKIPYVCGTTSEDILPDQFPAAARNLSGATTYVYYFSRQLPGDNAGAWHSSDLWYFFGTLDKSWRPFEPWDYSLSKTYMNYVANFVKHGDPNSNVSSSGEAIPYWAPYKEGKCVLTLGDANVFAGNDPLC